MIARVYAVAFAALALAVSGSVSGAEVCDSPKPGNLGYSALSSDVPKEAGGFLGHWSGWWRDGKKKALCHNLYVTKIERKNDGIHAVGFYSVGAYAPWDVKPGIKGFSGMIDGDDMTIFIKAWQVTVEYEIDDDELEGTFQPSSVRTPGNFTKVTD